MTSISEERSDIQGIIISGYKDLYHSRYLFLHFDSPPRAKAWLTRVVPFITNADRRKNGTLTEAVNLAFTYEGLCAIGYPAEGRDKFSAEFITGMADDERSRRLGDIGASHPGKWEIGGRNQKRIHALLIVQSAKQDDLDQLQQKYAGDLPLAAPPQNGSFAKDNREHFGFADGISQPEIKNSPRPQRQTREEARRFMEPVPEGEFVLGYPNAYEMFPATPTVPAERDPLGLLPHPVHAPDPQAPPQKDFGRNGSYLVFRKLYQDVAGFRRFVSVSASPDQQELLAAKLVGRFRNGDPLVKSPDKNSFGYHDTDPDGLACPVGAHIRRANPRDDLEHDPAESLLTVRRHRIMRRGASYGPRLPEGVVQDDGQDRGLLFLCVNADIRRQFEFVQQTWLNNPKFAGLNNDRDPIVGQGGANMTVQHSPVRQCYGDLPRFVTMRGGQYFFLPGIRAMNYLCTIP
jgi:Dyp-type peroxidase family